MTKHLSKPIEPLITKSDLSCMQKKKKKVNNGEEY